ncbi:hypothetical protein B0H14DRAFT_2563116 [Mycena olivaceomarginata]|nr:hypothetical protein B0H14DRAFT_2563116 [Mycena olivaceomarginata]
MAGHVLVLFQRLRWHPLPEPPPAIFPGRVYIQRLGVGQRISEAPTLLLLGSRQSEGLVKFLIEHEDNTLYQNTAENPQKARDVPLRGRKELVEAPVLPLIVLYKTRDVLLGGCQIIVGGTCIIFSGLVSADGVEEEVWFHPRMGTEISGGACFTSNMVVGKLGAC